MLPGLAAASSALDALQSLTATKSKPAAGHTHRQVLDFFGAESSGSAATAKPTPTGSPSQSGALSPELLSALLAALGKTGSSTGPSGASSSGGSDPFKELFTQVDADRDGQLSKSEFENSLGAGRTNLEQADDVFSKMDQDGDGSVSLGEMMSALKGKGHRHHHHHAAASDGSGGATGNSGSDQLLQALQGASSTSVSNSNGSTTTSLTYADGSTVTMTSPASGAAISSYNFIEQMIERQARTSAAATSSLSLSA